MSPVFVLVCFKDRRIVLQMRIVARSARLLVRILVWYAWVAVVLLFTSCVEASLPPDAMYSISDCLE